MVVAMLVIMLDIILIQNAGRIVDNLLRDGENAYNLFSNSERCKRLNVNLLLPLDRYHVPRSWLSSGGNSLVVFEEWGGDPNGIALVKRT